MGEQTEEQFVYLRQKQGRNAHPERSGGVLNEERSKEVTWTSYVGQSLQVSSSMRCTAAQSHLTLGDPVDCSLPGSSVHGIFQARVLERVAMPSSRGSSPPRGLTPISFLSCIGRQILYHWTTWEARGLCFHVANYLVSFFTTDWSLDPRQDGRATFC